VIVLSTAPSYVNRLLDICSGESVDVVFQASREEALTLTKNSELFSRLGTVITVSRQKVC
jgi:hypothetical protein